MGLILDSSVLIASERRGWTAKQALTEINNRLPEEDLAISVITIMELTHGISRSDTEQRRHARTQFLSDLVATLSVYAVTASVAALAGVIDGGNRSRGVHIGVTDFLIGATALELGYAVATHNIRHFAEIPGVQIIPY